VFEEFTLSCIWCPRILEVKDHLFCRCSFSGSVWYYIFKWVGGHKSCLSCKWSHLPYYFSTGSPNKKHQKRLTIIWHATARKIWKARNKIIFSSKSPVVEQIVEEIKITWWRWFLGRKKKGELAYILNGFRILSYV